MPVPKLTVRVRFPSPALIMKAQVGEVFRTLGLRCLGRLTGRRAINVPLARSLGRVALVVVLALLLFDVRVDRVPH